MNKKTSKKTSVNVAVGLVEAYNKSGSSMKKAVLSIRPSDLTDATLRNLFKKYKIAVPKGTTNLWQKKEYFDELSAMLFSKPSDRKETTNVKLHLTDDEKAIIQKLSGEAVFSTGFRRLLLLHYAMQQQNIKQVEQNIVDYYNTVVIPHACMPKASGITTDTGLYVLGNKKWFLGEFREILRSVPDSVKTFVEPFMGSGIVTFETCNQGCFRRIITNDIYWHKANYIRALFHEPDVLKGICLNLRPDHATYDKARVQIQKYEKSTSKQVYPDIAGYYRLSNYCEDTRPMKKSNNKPLIKKERFLETNQNAQNNYRKNLDFLWDIPVSAKKVTVHSKDALDIIKENNRKNNLLFVDPPYPETIDYENGFSTKDFENLAKDVINYKGYFIFCCRITHSHRNCPSHKGIYGMVDLHIKNIIDRCFFGHKLYYKDYLYTINNVNAIERVITNFPFTGCYHYDTGQPWQGE